MTGFTRVHRLGSVQAGLECGVCHNDRYTGTQKQNLGKMLSELFKVGRREGAWRETWEPRSVRMTTAGQNPVQGAYNSVLNVAQFLNTRYF